MDQDGEELDAGLDAELDSLFRRLDLNLPSGSFIPPTSASAGGPDAGVGGGVHAEPTAQDEELARRFLASIADFEKYQFAEQVGIGEKREGESARSTGQHGARGILGEEGTTLPESEEERNRHQAEALRKLEEWLQNEDGDWPGASASASTSMGGVAFEDFDLDPSRPQDEKAQVPPGAGDDAFDDDFDEFISATATASSGGRKGEGEGADVGPASFGFDEELSRHPHYKPAVDARRSKEDRDGQSRAKGGGSGKSDSDSDGDADGQRVAPSFDWAETAVETQPADELKDDADADAEAVEPSSSSSSSAQGPFHSFPPSAEFVERLE
jgi:hypothetical protein